MPLKFQRKYWDFPFLAIMHVLTGPPIELEQAFTYCFVRMMRGLEKHCSLSWKVRFEIRGRTSRLLPGVHHQQCAGAAQGEEQERKSMAAISKQKMKITVRSLGFKKKGSTGDTPPPKPHTRRAFVGTSYIHLQSCEWSDCLQKPENPTGLIFRSRATPW